MILIVIFFYPVTKEVERLNSLPETVKEKFTKPITELALEHVAANLIPDYISPEDLGMDY